MLNSIFSILITGEKVIQTFGRNSINENQAS